MIKQMEAERKQREVGKSVSLPKVDVSWVKKDVLVSHKSFGTGRVSKIKEGYVYIVFQAGEKQFAFPNAFENGFLSKPINKEVKQSLGNKKPLAKTDIAKNANKLIEILKENQFICIDNRTTSGILWVLYSVDKKAIFEELIAGYNVSYKLERRGAVATKNAPAWRIMFN